MRDPDRAQISAEADVRVVESERDAAKCWAAFKELRPHLKDTGEFIRRWQRQHAEGYRLVYTLQQQEVVAAAGFRLLDTMAWGKVLYLDDLIVPEACRGRGFGAQLLRWLQATAKEKGCDELHLDTGYQRHKAHLVYLSSGFELACHHLAWKVPR